MLGERRFDRAGCAHGAVWEVLELAGDEVDDADEVVGGLESAGSLFGGLDGAVEALGKAV